MFHMPMKIELQEKGVREMAGSVLKSTGYSSRDPKFNSQQPCGSSQPSVMRSDVLFCHAGIHCISNK